MGWRLSIRALLPTAILGLCFLSCGTCNLPPQLTSISPTSVTAGSGQFTLTVNGNHFVPGASVVFNGVYFAANFVNSSQLTVLVPANAVASPASFLVSVLNPPGSTSSVFGFTASNGCGGLSNSLPFTVKL